jgi:hypothetical protein
MLLINNNLPHGDAFGLVATSRWGLSRPNSVQIPSKYEDSRWFLPVSTLLNLAVEHDLHHMRMVLYILDLDIDYVVWHCYEFNQDR